MSYIGPMAKKPRPLSIAALALVDALKDEALQQALEEHIHRTMLWRWSTGRALPDLDRAFLAERLTGGRVRAKGWTEFPVETRAVA